LPDHKKKPQIHATKGNNFRIKNQTNTTPKTQSFSKLPEHIQVGYRVTVLVVTTDCG